jgi:geranylgeranyl reductase family protein
MIYDVIVIGMGPAGAIAAYEAASRNLSVLALDRARFPRYKTCGGGLTAKVHQILGPGPFPSIEKSISALRLSCGPKKKTFSFDRPFAYMVMRETFDQMLVDRAVKRGVDYKEASPVGEIREQNDYIEVYSGINSFKGRVAIGADGALGVTSKWLNPDFRIKSFPGIEGEFKKKLEGINDSTIEIEVGHIPSGYGWIFPKQEVFSIGAASFSNHPGLKASFRQYASAVFSKSPLPPSCIKESGHPLPVYANARLKLHSKRMALAGDAGHLVDPFFGEGIYYAMRSGQIAAEAAERFIHQGTPLSGYSNTIRREFYPEFKSAGRVAWLVYRFPEFLFDLTEKHPGVIQLYIEVLSGKRTYRSFLPEILLTAFKRLFQKSRKL